MVFNGRSASDGAHEVQLFMHGSMASLQHSLMAEPKQRAPMRCPNSFVQQAGEFASLDARPPASGFRDSSMFASTLLTLKAIGL